MAYYVQANAILENCPQNHKDAQLKEYGFLSDCVFPDGTKLKCCTDCWNAHVYARKQARKEELAAHRATLPKCARCQKKPGNWNFAGFTLCGRCKTAASREHQRAAMNAGFLAFGAGLLVDTRDWKR